MANTAIQRDTSDRINGYTDRKTDGTTLADRETDYEDIREEQSRTDGLQDRQI